ncbi:hypothetical protein [uncultured Thiodictyon sp.]|nr:hypothetical protein [uncultured Thiodictyon sp.]
MTSDLKDWKQTAIYAEVDSGAQAGRPGFAEAKHLLDSCMNRIQAVLQQGGTAATDFTLHDAQHGYHVAERMVEIVPEDVLSRLTAFELALLLLSAYLHDIGMTPEQHRVRGHYRYLLTGEPSGLAATEIDRFRQWLDEHGDGVTPPLAESPPTGRTLGEAEWLVAHYCRERHNDWSGEWIEANLAGERLGTYQNWRDNLIAICKSHHVGFDELDHPRFDPIMVGAGHVVHLRYLASVLRLADVLENDPERTPEVVLRQRDVDSSSLIYWRKDHDITTTKIGDQYRLEAHPRSALIHKATRDTAAMIEAELLVCRRLANETDFSRLRGSSTEMPHRWNLSATLTQRIEPLDGAYEYIDGSFRPDVRRVLRLLAGVELYGDPMAAVRELLQNAFDAVRERIARERLSDPGNPDLPDMLGKLYSVQLHLERGTDGDWLVCKDRGAGMSKSIIRDHFLVSGAVKRADLLQLARRCEQADFRLERTARFGIGVLSFFMVADRLHIRTRRCQSAQSGEANGWRFETDGLSGFGELKRDPDCLEGTEVRLLLKPEVIGTDASAFWDRLLSYVRSVLLHVPCKLQIKCPSISEASWSVDAPGWVRKPGDYATQCLTVLESPEERPSGRGDLPEQLGDLTPSERLTQWQGERDRRTRLREAAHERLRWSQPVTGDLPGGLGRFRVFFPWFELDDGPCLDFFSVRKDGSTRVLETEGLSDRSTHGVSPWCPFVMGWFGMTADHDADSLKEHRWRGVIEVDWTAAAAAGLEVSRNRLQPSEQALKAIRDLYKNLAGQLSEFARSHQASIYALYNTASLDIEPPAAERRFWLYEYETERQFNWRAVSYPSILSGRAIFDHGQLRWQGYDYPSLCTIELSMAMPSTGHL